MPAFLLLTAASCQDMSQDDCFPFIVCDPSADSTDLRIWEWAEITLPAYEWPGGTAFGDGLFVDVAYDTAGVSIEGDKMRFQINPKFPQTPANAPSPHNYRAEIHTMPWEIQHPLGTEQWMGWRYTFGADYEVDAASPITIFQNHPGVRGLSPQLELELAAFNNPPPAGGGEIQLVNEANRIRKILPVRPKAGTEIDIVLHVIYGVGEQGLLQLWIDDVLYHSERGSTVYTDHPFGGNNKWGIYHHTFNNQPERVQRSINGGAGSFTLYMSPLRMLTRSPGHLEYGTNAYHFVDPKNSDQ
ncbi:MAG: heparin lyase I family protein [Bacteroidota bacterium]